jgi:hypothetical protein
MIIEFETTQKVLYSFSLDPTETSKFLHWQLTQDGPDEKDILRYLESRDLPRQNTYFSLEIQNMISDENDED